jgi:hypothetical protein
MKLKGVLEMRKSLELRIFPLRFASVKMTNFSLLRSLQSR